MEKNLNWQTIYYHQEHDINGELLSCEWTEEAEYRGGHLIKHMHQSGAKIISQSLTFIPYDKNRDFEEPSQAQKT